MHKIFSALSAQCSQISVFLRRLKSALCTVCGVAACTVLCESNLVKREFHYAISFMFKGALLSETWISEFLPLAAQHRPPPTEPMIPGVMVTTFDNLQMNVAYKSISTGGATGQQLKMTNWFAVSVRPDKLTGLAAAHTQAMG